MEGDQSRLVHSILHLSIIWTELLSLFFPAAYMCCNARKWWQWLVLKRDGFISTHMATASQGTLLVLHPSRCIWVSEISFWVFPYENLLSGENDTCTCRIHYEKFICLVAGWTETRCSVFVPRCPKGKKHLCGQGRCRIVHGTSLP